MNVIVSACPAPELTHLAALEHVVPDGGAAEVDVEVGVAAVDGHQAVLLHLGVHHVVQHVGRLCLQFLQVSRPNSVHPVDLPHLRGQRGGGGTDVTDTDRLST